MYMHPPFFGFPSHLSLLLFSHPVVSDSLRSHGLQYICQASLPFTIVQSLLKLTSIASVMACSHLILWYPLLLLPLIFPSIRDFSKELAVRIRWPKYGASASVLPVSIRSWFPLRLICFDLLAVQGTLRSLLQHHGSKASTLWHLTFFMMQLSQLYMTTGKTTAVTIRTFVSRVMSLLLTHLGHHKALDRDPCTIQQGLIRYFIHSISSVYMSIPVSQFILPHAFPLGVGMFVFYVCVSASAL